MPHHPSKAKRRPPTPPTKKKTDWTGVAEWYDRLVGDNGSEFHQQVVIPGVVRLISPQTGPKGQRVLDIACGQGVLCRALRERGAEVTGIDAATPLIRAARERGPTDIRYEIGDARDLTFLPEATFDSAACVLAIQNIHPIRPVMDSVSRILKPLGRFVIVMMHPCFRGPKETSWGWDDDAKVQFRRVDRYLVPRKSPIVARPGAEPDVYTWTFHKPIEHYIRALRGAGLLVDSIEEWPSHKTSTSGPRAVPENVARKEIPMFMAIRAVKVAVPRDIEQGTESDSISIE